MGVPVCQCYLECVHTWLDCDQHLGSATALLQNWSSARSRERPGSRSRYIGACRGRGTSQAPEHTAMPWSRAAAVPGTMGLPSCLLGRGRGSHLFLAPSGSAERAALVVAPPLQLMFLQRLLWTGCRRHQ